jgi:hypothetical protein
VQACRVFKYSERNLRYRVRVNAVTKSSLCYEFKREGRNSTIHRCFLSGTSFEGTKEKVFRIEYQSRAWKDSKGHCSGGKGTRPVPAEFDLTHCPKCWDV